MRCLHSAEAIVANHGDGTLSIINLKTKKVESTIILGKYLRSHHIWGDFNNKYLYITNIYDSSVSKFDYIIESVIDSLYVGSNPCHLAISKHNESMYVVNEDSNCVSVVDYRTMFLQAQIPVGQMPHDILLNSKRDKLYVSNMRSGSISVIDIESNDIDREIKVSGSPYHMSMDTNEKFLFIANYDYMRHKGLVTVMSTEDYGIEYIEIGKVIIDMVVSNDGTLLYCIDGECNQLYIYDLVEKKLIKTIQVGNMPVKIEIDRNNNLLLICNSEDDTLSIIDMKMLKQVKDVGVGREPTFVTLVR